jgi:hypothetical protein
MTAVDDRTLPPERDYGHVLAGIQEHIDTEQRLVAQYEADGWDDCVRAARARLTHWELLYDAVHGDGLLRRLAAEATARRLPAVGGVR